jgi:hypothetical protein
VTRERRSQKRDTCYVMRSFGVILAKRAVFDSFTPIGLSPDGPGNVGDVLLLMKGCRYTEEEVLAAYNAAGYPAVELCTTLDTSDFNYAKKRGYAALMAEKIKGKRQ